MRSLQSHTQKGATESRFDHALCAPADGGERPLLSVAGECLSSFPNRRRGSAYLTEGGKPKTEGRFSQTAFQGTRDRRFGLAAGEYSLPVSCQALDFNARAGGGNWLTDEIFSVYDPVPVVRRLGVVRIGGGRLRPASLPRSSPSFFLRGEGKSTGFLSLRRRG